MKCAPIDTEAPRFYVSTIEGYPIYPTSGAAGGGYKRLVLVATVIDSFYGSEHGRFASNEPRPVEPHLHVGDPGYGDRCACGGWKARQARRCMKCRRGTNLGRDAAVSAAAERCAELNAWHEREGWGE